MEETNEDPTLFIVGAGPGDPELITMKAYRVLKRANVILYDNLCNKEILTVASKACEIVYVGKQPYGNSISQDKINDLIVDYARKYKVVVRLKGGDPFIFGRGFEELLFAEAHGIKSKYIPGISSMQGAGYADISLTHRGISESLWIITGTKKDGNLSADLKCARNSSATVVIYMGMKKLAEIASIYAEAGLGTTPAAIIQYASLPHQKHLVCDVQDLQKAALKEGISNPAIIIIGNVIKAREILYQRNQRQLVG